MSGSRPHPFLFPFDGPASLSCCRGSSVAASRSSAAEATKRFFGMPMLVNRAMLLQSIMSVDWRLAMMSTIFWSPSFLHRRWVVRNLERWRSRVASHVMTASCPQNARRAWFLGPLRYQARTADDVRFTVLVKLGRYDGCLRQTHVAVCADTGAATDKMKGST